MNEFPDQKLFEPEEGEELYQPTLKDTLLKASKTLFALVAILGLFSLSGVYHIFSYQRTPVSTQQEEVVRHIPAAQELVVPLQVFIVGSFGVLGAERTLEETDHILENAEEVWKQANIIFDVQDVLQIKLSDEDVGKLLTDPVEVIPTLPDYDPNVINAFLVKSLLGYNGIAFIGIRSIAVADYTTVFDFRAFAHEVGHILGLSHVPQDNGRLMYQGANGFELSEEEVVRAREVANYLFY